MYIKELDLCNREWKEFRKQLNSNGIYLVKVDNKWHVTNFRYISSRNPPNDLKKELHKNNPHNWDVNIGIMNIQCSHRSNTHMDEIWQEVYEILDKELIKKELKK